MKLVSMEKVERREKSKKVRERKEARRKAHVLPSPLDKPLERRLRRTATRGVVALFNAISQHQRQVKALAAASSAASAKLDARTRKVRARMARRAGGEDGTASFLERLRAQTGLVSGNDISRPSGARADAGTGSGAGDSDGDGSDAAGGWDALEDDFLDDGGDGWLGLQREQEQEREQEEDDGGGVGGDEWDLFGS